MGRSSTGESYGSDKVQWKKYYLFQEATNMGTCKGVMRAKMIWFVITTGVRRTQTSGYNSKNCNDDKWSISKNIKFPVSINRYIYNL